MTEKKSECPAPEAPFRPFRSAVAGAARAVTRPIVTIMFAGAVVGAVYEGVQPPDWFIYGLAMPTILWWFGERTVRRFKGE